MITARLANILERNISVTLECPACHEILILDIDEALGLRYITIVCDNCKEESKLDMFEYFACSN